MKKSPILRWKFLRTGLKSDQGNCKWTIGRKKIHRGKLSMCSSGFHCSRKIYQAISFVAGEVLAQVECGGRSIIEDDKEVYSQMKIVQAYKWQKKDSEALSIYAAESVLCHFENQFPDDKRPRQAIESAKTYLKNPTKKNRLACETAASSAESAEWSAARSAGSSARSAARSAESAARSAWSAARSTWSAVRSAESAESAAWSARTIFTESIDCWMTDRIKKLKHIQK